MAPSGSLDRDVPLPPGLEVSAIRNAIHYVEEKLAEWVDLYLEQVNVFSAVVGILGAKALDSLSNYERHRNIDTMQQRFPDLKMRGCGTNPIANHCLESKGGSKRPWAIQSHFDHPGWYIVWRYLVDPTMTIDRGKPVVIWRVDVVFLQKADWKYEGSKAGSEGGGRTQTFGKRAAEKLRGKAVYTHKDVVIRGGKAIHKNGADT